MSEPVTDTVSDSIALAALAGLVWFDGDGDGIQDAGETNRIMNLPVTLL